MLCNDGIAFPPKKKKEEKKMALPTLYKCKMLVALSPGWVLRPCKKAPTIRAHGFAPTGPNRGREMRNF
jgi:hypothetical protein